MAEHSVQLSKSFSYCNKPRVRCEGYAESLHTEYLYYVHSFKKKEEAPKGYRKIFNTLPIM